MSKVVKIGDIASLKTGPFGTQFSAKEYTSEGIPVINVKNIGYGQILENELDYIHESTRDRLSEHILKTGDIVFGRKGSVDRHAYISENYNGWVQGSDCIRLRFQEDVNTRYISHYLKLDHVKKQINHASIGSTMASLNTDILKNIKIILPELSVQNSIEGVLSLLESKVDVNSKICSELEAMAKTLYDYWFVQFDFPDENGKPYRTAGGEMVWNEQLKRKIPKGWKHIEYSELVDIENSSINPSSFGETLMEHYSIPAFDEDCMPAFDIAATIQSGKYKVLKESFLVSKLNPQFKRIWNPYCLTDNAICSTEFMVYKPKNITLRPICYAIANSDGFYNHMVSKAIASTGSRKRIQPDVSIQYSLAFPLDRFIVDRFCSHYSPIMEKIKKARLENYELKKLRDWLLPMLMNGQATVVDAEEDTGKVIPYTPQTVEVRQAARNFGDKETDDTADLVQAYLRRKQHDSKTQNRN